MQNINFSNIGIIRRISRLIIHIRVTKQHNGTFTSDRSLSIRWKCTRMYRLLFAIIFNVKSWMREGNSFTAEASRNWISDVRKWRKDVIAASIRRWSTQQCFTNVATIHYSTNWLRSSTFKAPRAPSSLSPALPIKSRKFQPPNVSTTRRGIRIRKTVTVEARHYSQRLAIQSASR